MPTSTPLAAFAAADSRLPTAYRSLVSFLPSERQHPKVGIVCGSGLGGIAEALEEATIVQYQDVKAWPQQSGAGPVKGHKRGLTFGRLGGCEVVCQMGRMHCYEGYPIKDVIFAVRIFKLLGCKAVILTNAAGAVNTDMHIGQIMTLHDHLSLPSLTSWNPLIGPNFEDLGPRFPPMSDAYDFELRKSVFRAARSLGLAKNAVSEGTYAWVAGPTYETRSEGRFIRASGADVVGMSTVPEVIAARHVGLRVLAISLVTNIVVRSPYRSAAAEVDQELAGKEPQVHVEETANHEEVLEVGRQKTNDILKIVTYVTSTFA